MAASDAAAPPPLAARADRPSPVPAAQSKRDRKRQVVMERLAVLTERFQHDKDSAYRDQLQRIQFELGKLQKVDPYAANAVEVASEAQQEQKRAMGTPVRAESARSLMDMAGMQFPHFMSDVQDVLESRDFTLSLSKDEYERKVQEYKTTHTFKVVTAKREHESLDNTMRDRLINQLNTKKARLSKEKEAFEISDTNALLLNPAQFSLTNPGSPGSHPGKRSTRNRKEADDSHGYGDNKKRKRNGADEEGSPAPSRRNMEASATTPYWQSEKARNEARKHGSVYTISSLFTEKELAMYYNTSALAAHNYILRHRGNGSVSSPEGSDSGFGDNDVGEVDAPPASSAMERQVSHATQSTRGNQPAGEDKTLGADMISTQELTANLEILHTPECPPKMPMSLPTQYIKNPLKGSEVSAPGTLSEKEVTADMQIISGLKQYDSTRKPGSNLETPRGIRKTLEIASAPHQISRFGPLLRPAYSGIPPPPSASDMCGISALINNVRDMSSPGRGSQQANGQPAAASMSRQSSAGGVAMSRQGTAGSSRGKTRRA